MVLANIAPLPIYAKWVFQLNIFVCRKSLGEDAAMMFTSAIKIVIAQEQAVLALVVYYRIAGCFIKSAANIKYAIQPTILVGEKGHAHKYCPLIDLTKRPVGSDRHIKLNSDLDNE